MRRRHVVRPGVAKTILVAAAVDGAVLLRRIGLELKVILEQVFGGLEEQRRRTAALGVRTCRRRRRNIHRVWRG